MIIGELSYGKAESATWWNPDRGIAKEIDLF